MMGFLRGCLAVAGCALACVAGLASTYTESSEAFRNPMKGFRPSRYITQTSFPANEFATIYKDYMPYSSMESTASDSVQKIKDYCNTRWAGIESQNIKVIPRVVILYPGTGEYWGDIPHDGTPNQWNTDALKSRLVAFINKLGQAWDNDPRVAAVELGLWGKWGEHNIYPDQINGSDRIPAGFQTALGDAAAAAFHNKIVMVRYPETFTSYNVGYIWDSFALPDDVAWANAMSSRNTWQTKMLSGEVAYDWGNQSQLGGSPDGTLGSTSNTDYVISYIQSLHVSSLGWIAEYTASNSAVEANATRMQKAFGYRYVITDATIPTTVNAGSTLSFSFTVANRGSAPFYYQWPIEVSLLDSNKAVAWSTTLSTDIRTWMPGNSYPVSASVTVPSSVATGTYTLALTVLDPAGNKPALRFANTNYYNGGRTPLAKVGVGQAAANQNLGTFDGLKADSSLSYSLTTTVTTPSAPTLGTPTVGSGSVALSWSSSSGATSYAVLRSTTSGSGYSSIATPSGTTYTDTGVTNGTTYYYVVRASNSAGTSGNSNQVSATPTAVSIPAAPTGLTATAGNASVSLSWSASSGATGYAVLRSTTSGSGYTSIATPSGTSYTDVSAVNGTTYYYVVRATNSAGTSGNSSQVSATPVASGPAGTYEAEASGNTLTGTAVVATSATSSGGQKVGYLGNGASLTFNNVSVTSAGSYTLTISYLSGEARSLRITVNNGTSVTPSLASSGGWDTVGTYTTSVTLLTGTNTIKLDNPSGWAPDIDKIVLSGGSGVTVPSAPTGLTATAGNATVTLSWTASSGATSYNVLRSTTSGSGYTSVGTSTSTSYSNTGLTNGTTYYYVVTATNSAGTSGNSSQASATPAASGTIPAAPLGLTATASGATVALSWNASSGATSYTLLRSTTSGSGYGSIVTQSGLSYTDTSVSGGTTYYYVVRATNSAGTSGNSSQVFATPSGGGGGGSVTYEAEASGNTLAGGAVVVTSATSSGGQKVGYLGNGGAVTINGVSSATTRAYTLVISYLSGEARNLRITVNSGAPVTPSLASTGGWDTLGTYTTTVTLTAGTNTIKLDNPSGWAPDVDKIVLTAQ